jgi:hypothetical protein
VERKVKGEKPKANSAKKMLYVLRKILGENHEANNISDSIDFSCPGFLRREFTNRT